MTEQPTKQFHVKQFADFGTSEGFVLPVLDLIEILNATTIFDPQRSEVSGRITAIVSEGLAAAFLEMRKIQSSVGQDVPMLNYLQMYEDFYGKLWRAYKEYMQRAVKAMGFDIGFLFQKDAKFEEGLKAFREANSTAPSALEEYLREVRRTCPRFQRIAGPHGLRLLPPIFAMRPALHGGIGQSFNKPFSASKRFLSAA